MQKTNYNEEYKKVVKNIDINNKPSLLLHACCSPCLIGVIEKVFIHFKVTILYYNPNIYPESEYDLRLVEIKRLIEHFNYDIDVVSYPHLKEEFYTAIKGKEHLGERSDRCKECFKLRLKKTAEYAIQNNYDYFTTTLTISPLKDTQLLNELMQNFEKTTNVKHLASDFKKDNGYVKSIKLSKELNLYRQDYCGCVFSIRTDEQSSN